MADGPTLEEIFRRAVEANLHYYRSLGKVTGEYLKALANVVGDSTPVRVGRTPRRDRPARTTRAEVVVGTHPQATTAHAGGGALVLEGPAGTEVRAVFAISNDLDREVSAPVMSTGAAGPDTVVELRASPSVVTVARGERALVEVGTLITEEMAVGDTHRGEITVPGLSTHGIPVIVRRSAGEAPTAGEDSAATRSTENAPGRGRASGKKASKATAKKAGAKKAKKAGARKASKGASKKGPRKGPGKGREKAGGT